MQLKGPLVLTETRSLLEPCNDLRRFVPNVARIATPLNRVLKTDQTGEF